MQTDRQRQIQALLNAIPLREQDCFGTYYQTRLTTAKHQAEATRQDGLAADPDLIEAALIDTLIREAEGRDDPQGLGNVPTQQGMYQVEPPDDDPRLVAPVPHGAARPPRTRSGTTASGWRALGLGRILAGLAVVGLPLGWWLWGSLATPAPAADASFAGTPTVLTGVPTPTPLVTEAGGEVTVSSPASVEIARVDADAAIYRVVASAGTLGAAWTPEIAPGTVAWLNGSYINQILCVPPDATHWIGGLPRGTAITVRQASGGVRTYEVVRSRMVGRQEVEVLDQRRAGMTLILCGVGGNERQIVEAVERTAAQTAPSVGRGDPVVLPGYARLTVTDIQAEPATADTPTGYQDIRVTVEIENTSREDLPSSVLADQLELGGVSAERLPSATVIVTAQARMRLAQRYRVSVAGGVADWRVTAPTGEQATVRVTIPPAADRQPRRQVTAQLDPRGVQVVPTRTGQRLTIQLTLQPSGADPATVDSRMVSVWAGSRSVGLEAGSSPLPLTVQPGTPTTLTLVVTIPDVGQVDIQLDQQRFRVTLP